jgi:hypothetical protein
MILAQERRKQINWLLNKSETTSSTVNKGIISSNKTVRAYKIKMLSRHCYAVHEICKTSFLVTHHGSIINIQNKWRSCETVSIQNSDAASPSRGQ